MKKERKTRIVIAAIFLVLLTAANSYVSAALDSLLTQGVGSENRGALFWCFEGIILLFAAFYVVINNRPYQSDTIEITPNIYIPVPAGQFQHGSARFLKPEEFPAAFVAADISKELSVGGIVVGKGKSNTVYCVGEDTHALIIGSTRIGKSRRIVIPTICTLTLAGESIICTDPKGELFQYTSEFLKSKGYNVIILDFKEPRKSDCYNFLQPVIDYLKAGDKMKASEAVLDIVSIMVADGKQSEPIWTNGEKAVLAGAIMAVVWDNMSKPEYQNLTNVYHFIAEMCREPPDKKQQTKVNIYSKNLDEKHPARPLFAIGEIAPSRMRGSFYTSALTTLQLFVNESIYGMTCKSNYDVKTLGVDKTAVFVVLPDEKTTYYPLASLLVAQHYQYLCDAADSRGGRLQRRVNFVLDEFGNFTPIKDFATKLTVGGGRGIRFSMFLQSFSQLDTRYDKEVAKTITGNCETWLYLKTEDIETMETVSKKLGQYTVSTYSLSASHQKFSTPSSSHNISLTGRSLLTVDELQKVDKPYTLVLSRASPAMMYAPDLTEWSFNVLLGLGDKEHNRALRERVNAERTIRGSEGIKLWGIWNTINTDTEGDDNGNNQRRITKTIRIDPNIEESERFYGEN
ncbi:hypothetical protein FACS1894202_11430 [Clostridia bacterium]|nr:hypothetical protein FACS1894202_11430 [Clostridia bacterium]